MWVCRRCGSTFNEPEITTDHGDRCYTCPICMSRNVEEIKVCYICGNAVRPGWDICNECINDIKESFESWVTQEIDKIGMLICNLSDCVTEVLEEL